MVLKALFACPPVLPLLNSLDHPQWNGATVMAETKDQLSDLRIDWDGEDEGSPWPRRLGLLAVAIVLVALAFWWFMLRERAIEVSVVPVTVSETGSTAVSVLDASGYVTARRQSTVSSKITGKITEVLIEEGMVVEKGQILARLDDSLVRRQLALAEAQLTSSRSRLREIEVRRTEAQIELARQHDLVQADVASQRDLDLAQAEFDALGARLEALHDETVVVERQISINQQQLEDHLVRAPFSGVAISKNAQPGEMISPISAGGSFTRTGISTIVDMSSLEIEVDVNEAYINRVQPAQRVVATLDAYPDWSIPARVIITIPTADRQKATVRVRIAFEELGDPRILPDMGIKVSFQADQTESETVEAAPVLLIPGDAIISEAGHAVVFVLTGESVERRAVTLGGDAAGLRQVIAGLRAGERVVVEPPEGLAEGMQVRVRP
jgi:RND family efflux transporter MFP subunit